MITYFNKQIFGSSELDKPARMGLIYIFQTASWVDDKGVTRMSRKPVGKFKLTGVISAYLDLTDKIAINVFEIKERGDRVHLNCGEYQGKELRPSMYRKDFLKILADLKKSGYSGTKIETDIVAYGVVSGVSTFTLTGHLNKV